MDSADAEVLSAADRKRQQLQSEEALRALGEVPSDLDALIASYLDSSRIDAERADTLLAELVLGDESGVVLRGQLEHGEEYFEVQDDDDDFEVFVEDNIVEFEVEIEVGDDD